MPRARRWPAQPKIVDGLLGPIAVVRVATVDKQGSRGEWDHDARIIKVQISRSRINEWATYFHEEQHAVHSDAEITFADEQLEERICDAVALARTREMARTLGLTPPARRSAT